VLFSSTQLLPQLMQQNFNYTALLSGLALMPGGLVMLTLMPVSGQASGRIEPRYLIAAAMIVVSVAMWHMTSLTPDASFGFFAWARAFQMIGLPFLFIPISTVSYDGLPPEKTGQASSLINVARNLGGSIGVSLATTELARQSQVHQAYLVQHVYPTAIAYQESLRQAAGRMAAQGLGTVEAQREALAAIGQAVQQQASLLAYIDVFRHYALFSICMAAAALAMRRLSAKSS
jgi:DHA2 family multidrug resistance protein